MTPDDKPARSPRWRRWLRDLLILIVLVGAVQWWQSRSLAGGPAPALVGHLLDGTPYMLEPARGAHLVHFWATWCPICRLEQDTIDAIAGDHRVITVATTSGTAAELNAYLVEHGLTMPVLLDEGGELARNWGVNGVPASFIVDRDGRIVSAAKGYSTELGLRLRLWWANRP